MWVQFLTSWLGKNVFYAFYLFYLCLLSLFFVKVFLCLRSVDVANKVSAIIVLSILR